MKKIIFRILVALMLLFPATVYAQSECTLTPNEQQVYAAYFGTAEPPGAPIPQNVVRGFPDKTAITYRVLGTNAQLENYADQSMRFWQAIANKTPQCWPDIPFIQTSASDPLANHTFSIDSLLEWDCYGLQYPLTNGAGFDWETEDCDGYTYTSFDVKFTSPSRYLARHQILHKMFLWHTKTTGGIFKGIADKKQTCNFLATPELDADNVCWNPLKTATVDFFKIWRYALRQVPGSSTQ